MRSVLGREVGSAHWNRLVVQSLQVETLLLWRAHEHQNQMNDTPNSEASTYHTYEVTGVTNFSEPVFSSVKIRTSLAMTLCIKLCCSHLKKNYIHILHIYVYIC